MAVDPAYLADNSAWNRLKCAPVAAKLRPLVDASLIATCGVIEVEALYSARNSEEYERMRTHRLAILTYLESDEADWQRALATQRELCVKSQHRGVRIPDLVIAAIAQRYDLTLIHYDSDFDRIAEVTQQRTEWVVPRGSVE
jgi:predicted nucleic acid-binding protein